MQYTCRAVNPLQSSQDAQIRVTSHCPKIPPREEIELSRPEHGPHCDSSSSASAFGFITSPYEEGGCGSDSGVPLARFQRRGICPPHLLQT